MLKDKVVLITGASRGLGRATAIAAASQGAKVVINFYSNSKAAKAVKKEIDQIGSEAILIQADVSDEDQVKTMFQSVKTRYGKLDCLVSNAGIMKNDLLMLSKTSDFDQMVASNCKGLYLVNKHAVKLLIKSKGSIVNLASVVGTQGATGQTIYSATKAFAEGFTRSLAKELAPLGVRVNAVAPGFIKTDLTQSVPTEQKEKVIANIRMRRMGTPTEVAEVIVFLLSDKASYMTGEIVGINGGLTSQ